jgi:hypothetical protein
MLGVLHVVCQPRWMQRLGEDQQHVTNWVRVVDVVSDYVSPEGGGTSAVTSSPRRCIRLTKMRIHVTTVESKQKETVR